MSLEAHLNKTLEQLLSSESKPLVTAEQLIHSIDLTLLDENASIESLSELNDKAQLNKVAAVCVYSQHLSLFPTLNRVTVINFPQGNEDLLNSLNAIDKALELGVNEIDYVLPYQLYLDGKEQEALHRCRAIIRSCKNYNLTLKIILETGAFSQMQSVYEVSKQLSGEGCDFIKTSTGKTPQGASLSAVFAILSALKDSGTNCGLKVSGGVKTPLQAYHYARLAELMLNQSIDKSWFRIGASSLLDELTKT